MDTQQFDALTRRLAAGATRREVLKKLAVSAAGGWLARAGVARAKAAPGDDKNKTKKACDGVVFGARCGNGKLCCNGRCVKPCSDGVVGEDCDCFGTCCPTGESCPFMDGTCYCTSVGHAGGGPCGGACCTPDVTACHLEDLGGGDEQQECRPCLMSGPVEPGVPCCRITSCSGGICTCVA